MGRVRIVWGSGAGPTALSSYDAALAAANVHDYNLLRVSSVLPVDTTVEFSGTAPDLGPVGGRLTIVEARVTDLLDVRTAVTPVDPGDSGVLNGPDTRDDSNDGTDADRTTVHAGLGWAQAPDGRGIVYEATDSGIDADSETVHRAIETGVRAGCSLRELSPTHSDRVVLSADGTGERIETADGTTALPSDGPRHASTRADRSAPSEGNHELGGDSNENRGNDDGGVPYGDRFDRTENGPYVTAVVLAAYGESDPVL